MQSQASYSGPDRRARSRDAADERRGAMPARRGGRLLVLFVAALALASAVGPLADRFLDAAVLPELQQGLARLGIALFVSAALAYLLRWKLTGEAPVALVGTALLLYGVGVGLFLPVGGLVAGTRTPAAVSIGLVRAVVSGVAIYLFVRSLSTPMVESRLRPLRTFAVALLAVTAVFALLGVALRTTSLEAPPQDLDVVLHAAMSAGWALAAYLLVRRGVGRLQGDILWVGLALGCLALANGVRAVTTGTSAAGQLTAAAVSALAAAVALYGTTLHLAELLAGRGAERLRLYVDLVARDVQERTLRARNEERMHDARSTLAAIRCAAGTLQRYEDRLALAQRESLQTAVTAELVRLEKLIDPPPADQLQVFGLEEALAAIVETERTLGTQIAVQLRDASAYARPHDVARIVHNLLTNARRHAPGSPVRLSAAARDGYVTVAVADEGPGVPASQREAIFDRGRHSKAAGSTGLGLYVARQLALDLGGDLEVHDRIGGGAVFQLRLRSAPPEQVADEVADVGDAVQHQGRRAAVRRQKHGWLPGPVGEAQDVVAVGLRLPVQRDDLDGLIRG